MKGGWSLTERPELMDREDLEEEVLYLREMVQTQLHDERLAMLMADFDLSANEARLALLIYESGRAVSRERVLAVTRRLDRALETSAKLPDVIVHKVRRKLGQDTLQTHIGLGWSLTAEGRRIVAVALAFHAPSTPAEIQG